MKIFINATIYRNRTATEILVDKGVIQAIGNNLPQANNEVLDLKGRLVAPPYMDAHLAGHQKPA